MFYPLRPVQRQIMAEEIYHLSHLTRNVKLGKMMINDSKMKLVVATHNRGKVAEINEMLADAGVKCISLDEAGITFDVEENGDSFLANATLKAVQYAQATGLLTLADDSGLAVVALGGQPGVYTARYGGNDLTQGERNQLILDKLAEVEAEDRSAAFHCVMVVADGSGTVLGASEGQCDGQIASQPTGTGGFGYDPIFFLPDRGCTMAQLSSAEKHALSHRGQALHAILPILNHLMKH